MTIFRENETDRRAEKKVQKEIYGQYNCVYLQILYNSKYVSTLISKRFIFFVHRHNGEYVPTQTDRGNSGASEEYVPRRTVTVKKAKQKEQPPARKMSEHKTDHENEEDKGENIHYVFCVIP